MNDKPKINQKIEIIQPRPAPSLADACPLQHVTALIGLSRQRLNPDDVLRLIDKRHIRWAWDIARKGARRPEIRIWRQSFLACLAREKGEGEAAESSNLRQIIEAILPRPVSLAQRAAAVGLHELQRRFLCCRMHLHGLIDDGELCRVGKPRKGETTLVLYQSVVEFLRRRCMTL